MTFISNPDDRFTLGMPLFPWLFPTKAAASRARAYQLRVIDSDFDSQTNADALATRRAVIHTRQDLVLLFSLELDLHRRLTAISRGVWLLVIIALYVVWKHLI